MRFVHLPFYPFAHKETCNTNPIYNSINSKFIKKLSEPSYTHGENTSLKNIYITTIIWPTSLSLAFSFFQKKTSFEKEAKISERWRKRSEIHKKEML